MLKTKLFFDVMDKEYFDRLQKYILADYGMYFEITENRDEAPEALTVSDYINKRNKKDIFLIKEQKGDISKYRGASEICSALLQKINHENKKPVLASTLNPHILCVTSASGGTGKSTVAQAMCCSFALKGRKVLYINFNPFSSCENIFRKSGKNSFTRLRYYLKKPDSDISAAVKSLVSRNAGKRVDFIVNETPSEDGFIGIDEAARLMEQFKGGSMYNVVIFDIPSYPGEGHLEVMRHAAGTILIHSGEPDEKHRIFQKFLESKGVNHIMEAANFSGSGKNCIPRTEGVFSTHSGVFWDAIGKLCKATEENNDPGN